MNYATSSSIGKHSSCMDMLGSKLVVIYVFFSQH